eukprot:CAMPEP_0201733020 /NCGR_PEP_ID=MMETSP0593-20130828/30427_1 /ASSEMBLY_ACC=CAM_ASM_000672 /TAXON_ID=267983 /ORGANISM="Skeletonema japonicum, Strain CCMP2506" /LENGTH=72 /DNA_ID=CAMNT_0048226097 /DNA_START=28 /DNA_END=246 /DNA_ORIENTATION=+
MTQDCPICLEKISNPWGVCSPCGHPLHRNCWDQLVDSGRGGRRCPVCKSDLMPPNVIKRFASCRSQPVLNSA